MVAAVQRPRSLAPVVLGMAVLLGWSGPSSAQSPVRRAVQLFKEANVHYNLGQYELAVDKYSAAIRADPSIPGPYRNLGLCFRAMGKCELALPNFRKYLQLQPHGRHADRVRQEVAYCAAKVGEEPGAKVPVGEAQIVLRVSKPGAQIQIDGVPRGASPAPALPVQPGRRVVTVFLSGYLPWTGAVELVLGQTVELEVDLQRDPKAAASEAATTRPATEQKPGTLRLVAVPSRALVSVDGMVVALDEEGQIRLEPGERRVSVSQSGIEPWSRVVTIKTGQTTAVVPELRLTDQARSQRRWAWISVGAALALGLSGAAVGLAENRTFEEIRDYDRSSGSRSDLDAMERSRQHQALAANILYGLASAAFGAAVVLFVVTPERTEHPAHAVSEVHP